MRWSDRLGIFVGLLVAINAYGLEFQIPREVIEGHATRPPDPYNAENYTNPPSYGTPRDTPVGDSGGGADVRGDAQRDNNTSTEGTLCPNQGNPKATSGKPVILATGEKFLPQQDFAIGGVGGFALTRTWRQYPVPSTFTPSFGTNWASSLDYGVGPAERLEPA